MMDHTAILQLAGGLLSLLSAFVLGIWGAPKARMAHARALEKIRGSSTERLIASWEHRAETLEARQKELDEANASFRARVEALERQLRKADAVHVADLATAANLREELDRYMARCEAHEISLAERDQKIADLEARVAELEASLRGCPVGPSCKPKATTKAVSAKKKGKK